jgi:hypothetical protein
MTASMTCRRRVRTWRTFHMLAGAAACVLVAAACSGSEVDPILTVPAGTGDVAGSSQQVSTLPADYSALENFSDDDLVVIREVAPVLDRYVELLWREPVRSAAGPFRYDYEAAWEQVGARSSMAQLQAGPLPLAGVDRSDDLPAQGVDVRGLLWFYGTAVGGDTVDRDENSVDVEEGAMPTSGWESVEDSRRVVSYLDVASRLGGQPLADVPVVVRDAQGTPSQVLWPVYVEMVVSDAVGFYPPVDLMVVRHFAVDMRVEDGLWKVAGESGWETGLFAGGLFSGDHVVAAGRVVSDPGDWVRGRIGR